MLIKKPTLSILEKIGCDICIIGAGPIGLSMAMALEDRGLRILVLESGGLGREPVSQTLSEAEVANLNVHHDMAITVARRLGGTSNLWSGCCVPFDPIDFQARPWLGLDEWPIGPESLQPYLAPALQYLCAGGPIFKDPVEELKLSDPAFTVDTLERWSNQLRFQVAHRAWLKNSKALVVALHSTVLGFNYDTEHRIASVNLHIEGGERGRLPVKEVVLAAGGNESLRLMLTEQARNPTLFGGPSGSLGRFYMGHVNGQVADIVLENETLHRAMNFYVDAHGSYVRRRIVPSAVTQQSACLPNIAFWPVVPQIRAPKHRSGPLSAVFLALTSPIFGRRLIAESIRLKHVGLPPYRRISHLRNVFLDLPRTVGFVTSYLWKRYFTRYPMAGFFVENEDRRYGLEFHAEQMPQKESRITLSSETDRLGLYRLHINYRFSSDDAAGVVRAHDVLEMWLRANGLGRLVWRVPRELRAREVLAQSKHGNHQIGTIRMGKTPIDGVVDHDCRVFGVPNLSVASTAVLRSSSQANPTLAATQLGLRLAHRLALEILGLSPTQR